ncbi:hypothetical protein [Curvivirga sp.]|uniref:hypothetical protein n=1 Tax=Curvivirga sp. TaxID=2856848 RepID=UPI003B5B8654
MKTQKKTFILSKNHEPVKLVYDSSQRARALIQRIQERYPDDDWSINVRFPLYGTD